VRALASELASSLGTTLELSVWSEKEKWEIREVGEKNKKAATLVML